jgi:hypothetical protein
VKVDKVKMEPHHTTAKGSWKQRSSEQASRQAGKEGSKEARKQGSKETGKQGHRKNNLSDEQHSVLEAATATTMNADSRAVEE